MPDSSYYKLQDEIFSVTFLGDRANIEKTDQRVYMFKVDTLIYLLLFSLLLASLSTVAAPEQLSFMANLFIWGIVSSLFLVLSYLVTAGFVRVAPKLGLRRLYVPISSIFTVHVLYVPWQFLTSIIADDPTIFFNYKLTEVGFLYIVIQIANVFYVRYSVPATIFKEEQQRTEATPQTTSASTDKPKADVDETAGNKYRVGKGHLRIGKELILVNHVWSASAEEHYINIKTPNGEALIRGKLDDFAAEMGDLGIKVHRSHWVARSQVARLRSQGRKLSVVLHDGTKIPLAASRKAEFEAWLAQGAAQPHKD